MKILEGEIGLREETRTVEQARPALSREQYRGRATPLGEMQQELTKRVTGVIQQVCDLPDGPAVFFKEIALLTRVAQVMNEAHGLLTRSQTGAETIAAETEAIELLLQARRINSKSSGGGGGAAPGGGGKGKTDEAALARLGDASDQETRRETRDVRQATGTSGSSLPAEFRAGLDAYFDALESRRPADRPD